jgi:hypothetical protein
MEVPVPSEVVPLISWVWLNAAKGSSKMEMSSFNVFISATQFPKITPTFIALFV